MHPVCLLVLQTDKDLLLYIIHVVIKITFDVIMYNVKKKIDQFTHLRRWQNMSIISNSDFTQSSREKSSNYQNKREID